MGYQSKTWSLSDEVVAEVERRVRLMEKGSPNKVLKELLFPPAPAAEPDKGLLHHDVCGVRLTDADLLARRCSYCKEPLIPPARELSVELEEQS